jgi:hypothetical protein
MSDAFFFVLGLAVGWLARNFVSDWKRAGQLIGRDPGMRR